MGATWDPNITVNLLTNAAAVSRAEFGLICFGSSDVTFATGVHKLYETPQEALDDSELAASADASAAVAAFLAQSPRPARVMVAEVADGTVAADLTAAYAAQPFYHLVMQTRTQAIILLADTWVGTNELLYWAQSSDADFLNAAGGDVGEDVQTAATGRTNLAYHADDDEWLDMAWAASYAWADPDEQSGIAAYKSSFSGITVDNITATQKANILAYDCSAYLNFGSVPAMYGGNVSDGGWLDSVICRDWLKARTTERIQQLLLDVSALGLKIPYTDAGIAQIQNEVQAQQTIGENVGWLAPGSSTVTVPLAADISSAVKATRAFTMSSQQTEAGAVQLITMNIAVLSA